MPTFLVVRTAKSGDKTVRGVCLCAGCASSSGGTFEQNAREVSRSISASLERTSLGTIKTDATAVPRVCALAPLRSQAAYLVCTDNTRNESVKRKQADSACVYRSCLDVTTADGLTRMCATSASISRGIFVGRRCQKRQRVNDAHVR